MSVKDNFYQAVKELFNKDEENQSPLAKSLQSNADDSDLDSDTKDTKGLSMASSDNSANDVASTPLKKPDASPADTSSPISKPTLTGMAAATAGYSSVQNSTASSSEPAKPAVSAPSSSLFGAKPATPASTTTPPAFGVKSANDTGTTTPPAFGVKSTNDTTTTTPPAFGVKLTNDAPVASEPVSMPTSSIFGAKPAATSTTTPPAFGVKPTNDTPVSTSTSSLFGARPAAAPAPVKEERTIFSASAISNAAAEIPRPKVSTDELSASLNAIINDEYRPLSGSLESTVIAHGTVIKGDIQTTSDIEINGAVVGNIESQRSVSINGQVEGNIVAESIRLSQTSITGNLSATGLVILDKDSTLIGDIKGENIIIAGKVKGNIDGKGKATLKAQSVVAGNITIAEITIEDGAKLQGFIQTTTMSAN